MGRLKLLLVLISSVVCFSCATPTTVVITGEYQSTSRMPDGYYYLYKNCVIYSKTPLQDPQDIASFTGYQYNGPGVYKICDR